MMKLGVNIDHVATLRNARRAIEPNILDAACEAVLGGADGITVHLREDRRHIVDEDVYALKSEGYRLNLEMAATTEMIKIARDVRPEFCCIVPEKREEITTEGGLNVTSQISVLKEVVFRLKEVGIHVSFFVDPSLEHIEGARECGADFIEIHTGAYSSAADHLKPSFLTELSRMAFVAHEMGLGVNAGHGLNYTNVSNVSKISVIQELNIGHSIVSRSVFVGLKQAVSEMKRLII
jgi:pyridoxine 5-phosphate synthase